MTLVTTRNSGASYLNRVELQSGCLAVAHANLFIPSNLNGSCFDPSTGKVDQDRLEANLSLATQIYIDRVNNAPCGTTSIHLYPGAKSSESLTLRSDVLTYLKGNKEQKLNLQRSNSEHFDYIKKICGIQQRHGVFDLPSQYCFMLKCCYEPDCEHPVCSGGDSRVSNWFPNGPSISYIPLPIPDPDKPWGSSTCDKCAGMCSGHFLMPEKAEVSTLPAMCKPPSAIIKEGFMALKGQSPSDTFIRNMAKQCLLPSEEVEIWVEHLSEVQRNRKRGAQKAAETRKRKREQKKAASVLSLPPASTEDEGSSSAEVVLCAICGNPYEDLTEDVENWICCEKCESWFHFNCAGIIVEPSTFLCCNCSL